MAQLRDKHTSAFIAEGTPLEMALLAQKLGPDEVLFDDVGLKFDPQAVLDAHAEDVKATKEADVSDETKKAIQNAGKLSRGAIKSANTAVESARSDWTPPAPESEKDKPDKKTK